MPFLSSPKSLLHQIIDLCAIFSSFLFVIDVRKRLQLAGIRNLSLNQITKKPTAIIDTPNVENEDFAALKEVGVVVFIACSIN